MSAGINAQLKQRIGMVLKRTLRRQAQDEPVPGDDHILDLATAQRIAQAINARLGANAARAQDPATVALAVPAPYQESITLE